VEIERGLARLDEVDLAWVRSGPRRPGTPSVVLAHGLTDAAATWDRVALPLSRTRDVIRYDARGHGASSWARDYSVESHTADLIRLVRQLRLDRPVLIGHSMGAVHAALAAAAIDVTALVLEDPHWPELPQDGTKDIGASRRSVVQVAALTPAERHAHVQAEHPTWAEADLDAWVLARGHLDPDVVNWFGSWQTTNRWRDHVARLRRPTLLVTGGVDPTVTPPAAAEARQLCPQLRAVQIHQAGHNVRRDQYEAYWQAVTRFLADL
jgi:N-formylmaleamate deformylase